MASHLVINREGTHINLQARNGSCSVPERSEWFTANMLHYVYVLLSKKDQKRYVGYTTNLKNRVREHNQGKNASTAKRRPLELIYFEGHLSKKAAMKRERYYKTTKGKTTLKQILN